MRCCVRLCKMKTIDACVLRRFCLRLHPFLESQRTATRSKVLPFEPLVANDYWVLSQAKIVYREQKSRKHANGLLWLSWQIRNKMNVFVIHFKTNVFYCVKI